MALYDNTGFAIVLKFKNLNQQLCCLAVAYVPLPGSQGCDISSPSLLFQRGRAQPSSSTSLPSTQPNLPTLLSDNESLIGKRLGSSDWSPNKPSGFPQLPGWQIVNVCFWKQSAIYLTTSFGQLHPKHVHSEPPLTVGTTFCK